MIGAATQPKGGVVAKSVSASEFLSFVKGQESQKYGLTGARLIDAFRRAASDVGCLWGVDDQRTTKSDRVCVVIARDFRSGHLHTWVGRASSWPNLAGNAAAARAKAPVRFAASRELIGRLAIKPNPWVKGPTHHVVTRPGRFIATLARKLRVSVDGRLIPQDPTRELWFKRALRRGEYTAWAARVSALTDRLDVRVLRRELAADFGPLSEAEQVMLRHKLDLLARGQVWVLEVARGRRVQDRLEAQGAQKEVEAAEVDYAPEEMRALSAVRSIWTEWIKRHAPALKHLSDCD